MSQQSEEKLDQLIEALRKGEIPEGEASEDLETRKVELMARQLKGMTPPDEARMQNFKVELEQKLSQSFEHEAVKEPEFEPQSEAAVSWSEKFKDLWQGLRMPQVVPVLATLVIVVTVGVLGYRSFFTPATEPATRENLIAWVNDMVNENETMVATDLQESEIWDEFSLDDLELVVANQDSAEVQLFLELLEFSQDLDELDIEEGFQEFEESQFTNNTLS